jgi:hypothetical protein
MTNRLRSQVPYKGEIQVSPWDATLQEVRRSAYRVEWIQARVEAQVKMEEDLHAQEHDWSNPKDFEYAALAHSRELREWIKLEREERSHGAQVARAAISAGLSERYIESVQAEARMIADVLRRALGAANLTADQWEAATAELRVALADVGRELQTRHSGLSPIIQERPALEG